MAIGNININNPVVKENFKPTQPFFRLIAAIVAYINKNPVILDFAGTPENNVTARFKDMCWDTINDKLYFKSTATGDTGWVALN